MLIYLILIIINEKLRDKVPSIQKILDEIKRRYKNLIGKNVNVYVKEVKKSEKRYQITYFIFLNYYALC